MDRGADRHLGATARTSCRRRTAAAASAGPTSGTAAEHGSNPYANPVTGLHFVVDLNRMELLEIEDTHRVDEPRHDGRVRPAPRARTCACATTSSRSRSPSPRASRSRSTATRCAGRTGRCGVGFNHREGLVLHTRRLRRRGSRRAPAVVRRDGRPLPRPVDRPLPPHRVRHRRVGPGLHDRRRSSSAATASARSRYLDAVLHDTRGRAVHDPATRSASTRRTTAILWKHVDAQAGAEVRRSRRLVISFHVTVANYEYLVYWRLLPGRQHRVRGARDRDHGHDHLRRGRAAAVRHARRRAHLRAVPPALPRRAAGPRRRRRGQHRPHDRVRGRCRSAPDNPHGLALVQRSTPLRTEQEGIQDYDWEHPARVEGRQRASRPTGSARRSATSSCRAARFPRMLDPTTRRCSQRAQVHRPHAVGHARTHADERWPCGEFVVPERRRTAGCRSGPRRTARSRTPTSCSGTSSASTTSRARRTGR